MISKFFTTQKLLRALLTQSLLGVQCLFIGIKLRQAVRVVYSESASDSPCQSRSETRNPLSVRKAVVKRARSSLQISSRKARMLSRSIRFPSQPKVALKTVFFVWHALPLSSIFLRRPPQGGWRRCWRHCCRVFCADVGPSFPATLFLLPRVNRHARTQCFTSHT